MLLIAMMIAAAPTETAVQVAENPFAQSTPSKRPARRRPRRRAQTSTPASSARGSTYYANCAAARAAGAAPVMRGDPGYSRKLDRDNDGVGCE